MAALPAAADTIDVGVYGFIHGGINVGRFSTSGPQEARRGLLFGGGFEIPLGGAFYIQPEMNYVEKGARSTLNVINLAGVSDIYVKYDFVDIPVLLKAKYGQTDLQVEIMLGPYYGFAISRNAVVDSPSGNTNTDISSQLASSDYGAILGAGASFRISNDSAVYFNARYAYGFANLDATATSSTPSTTTRPSVNNIGIFLAFGYRILL